MMISKRTKQWNYGHSLLRRTTARALSQTAISSKSHKYPKLFAPLDLGSDIGILPNRALMGSMHTGLEGHSMPGLLVRLLFGKNPKDNEHDLHRMAEYFRARAQGGVGLMVTGGIAPSYQGWTGPFSSKLTNHREVELHKVVTEAVHSVQVPIVRGLVSTTGNRLPESVPARICLQILHTGRYAYHPFAVSASATKSPISPFPARALSKSGIERTIDDYVRTAVYAKEAGYDGVEIMGSEGYLLSQFLSPRTNLRTDEFGGSSLENRARMPLSIIAKTRQAVGQDFIIIFRLSLLDLVSDGLLFTESVELAKRVQDAGATILNTGIGWHEARVPTISTAVPRAAFAFPTHKLKQELNAVEEGAFSIPLVATNRINHPATAENVLQQGADMVSMARPFLADPDLLAKSREAREDEINTCIGCNQACLDHVFVGKTASCLVNPRACHETELSSPRQGLVENQRLKIAVVGAGPAGCAFAIAAAEQGHRVSLFDKDDAIGGQFHMAKRIPGKEEFHETLRYFGTMLEKRNVEVNLNTTIAYEDMKKMNQFDKWVIATGVLPRDPRIPGQDHPNVLSYIDVLKRRKPVGQKVAVIGAGGIGFDVSEYLLHYKGKDYKADEVSPDEFWKEWGIDPLMKERGGLTEPEPHQPERFIYLLQRKKSKLGANLGKTTGWIHRATLNQSGRVEMINNVRYEKIDENGHLHISQDGKTRILEVDNIVICAGQVEHRELEDAAKQDSTTNSSSLSLNVYTIGGAYAAGELDAKRAIDMGTRLALRIHDASVVPGKHVFRTEPCVEEKLYQLLKRFM
jgi:2,4-dienoyl-CoA reductase (NADPH2)